MSQNWTLTHGARTVDADCPEPNRAHPAYTVIDPQVIGDRLAAAGYAVRTIYGNRKRAYLKSPRTAILEARVAATQCEYNDAVHIYLDHRGSSAVKINTGVLRMCCANAFVSPDVRIHHCSAEARAFLADPAQTIHPLIKGCNLVEERLKIARHRPGGAKLVNFVTSHARRLGASLRAPWRDYSRGGTPSLWAGLQALTATHNRRLSEFAGRLLGDHWFDLSDDIDAGRALAMEAAWN